MSTTSHFLSTTSTLLLLLSLLTLLLSMSTPHWLTLQEPHTDPHVLEKLNPHDNNPLPNLLKVRLGLFKTCLQLNEDRQCVEFDFFARLVNRRPWELFDDDEEDEVEDR